MFCISALPARSSRVASSKLGSSIVAPSCFSIRLLSTESLAAAPRRTSPSNVINTLPKNKLPRRTASPQSLFSASYHPSKCSSIATTPSRRHASTSTAFSALARSYSTTAPASPSGPLTWNRFLALRKTRRRISLGSSVICGSIVLGTGLSSIMAYDFESTAAATFGIDPIAVLGLSSVGLIAIGWLLGPAFGNTIFGVVYRGHRSAIEAKEREFFTRIKKHRVDPANSSIANPVPDYYGEKIGSVADYRRWLKDQRAYNLKRGKDL